MDYSALITEVPLLSDQTIATLLGSGAVVLIVGLIILGLWKKLHENETLKREFITIVAHKFRTPLTQARWLTESLISDEQDSYKKENLAEIQKVNKNLINLTGTLIELTESDAATKTAYTFQKISLCHFLRTIGESMKDSFKEKNIFFAVQCPPEDIMAKIDVPRMEFVIQTLLQNALTYTPTGKNVDVTLSHSNRKASIAVIDHGIGIHKADLPHIFSKFYRTDNAQRTDTEGFGVGLYLANSIVRRHKGKLDVHSDGVNEGSTFTVTLKEVR
ncbi:MAG: HAMP domain-containing sensor histidine kinase [Patescibacteria group bacterium]